MCVVKRMAVWQMRGNGKLREPASSPGCMETSGVEHPDGSGRLIPDRRHGGRLAMDSLAQRTQEPFLLA